MTSFNRHFPDRRYSSFLADLELEVLLYQNASFREGILALGDGVSAWLDPAFDAAPHAISRPEKEDFITVRLSARSDNECKVNVYPDNQRRKHHA